MSIKKILLSIIILVSFTSCVKEDYFGHSEIANIKKIVVSNQSGNAKINSTTSTVTIEIPGGVNLSEITIRELELSSFASSDKEVGDTINLTSAMKITITSEDGRPHIWTIVAFVASSSPQLDNNELNQWFKTATNYYEPGTSATTTIWGTGNRGTQLLNKLATTPKDLGSGNLAAQMETLDNGPLGKVFGTPISSGSLFTGFFNPDKINPADPEAAVEFGTPFAGRPNKFRFKYSYKPGEVNKDKAGKILTYGDACDIYILLEVRLNGKVERLATAWFRSDKLQTGLSTKEVAFTYGTLNNTFPNYMRPANNLYVNAESAIFILPTHITFVASSSFDGAHFAGAIGSSLIVDDIEMIYQ